jgi:hypothetical protein
LEIVGGGPTGSTLALLLARLAPDPARIVLFQSEAVSRWDVAAHSDKRVIAINEGTRVLFDDLDAWPNDATPIETIHVSQRGRLGRTLITRQELNVAALGYVVRYSSLHANLLEAAEQSGITVITDKVASVMQNSTEHSGSPPAPETSHPPKMLRSKVMAGLLAFYGGWFGAHWFYLGRPYPWALGVLAAVLLFLASLADVWWDNPAIFVLFLPAFVGFIEAVVLLCCV